MPSPFQSAGAQVKPSKAAVLHVNRMFTGLWSQRNPLRDAATPYLYEKFYSATRYDGMLDGLNTEISVKLTLIRRPGSTPYNNNDIPAVRRFYAFRTFVNGDEQIKVIADCVRNSADPSDLHGTIRDVTGPVNNTILAYKTSDKASSFISIGNTLYWTDGETPMEWTLAANTWQDSHGYNPGDWTVDQNNNVQQVAVGKLTPTITGVACVNQTGSAGAKAILLVNLATIPPPLVAFPGATTASASLSGMTAHAEFNGNTYPILTDPSYPAVANLIPGTLALDVGTHAAFSTVTETGQATVYTSQGPFQSGSAVPSFSTTLGATTVDNQVIWQNKGSSVHKWGIAPPTIAPTVAQTAVPPQYPNWAGNINYSPTLLIADSSTPPNLQKLTTGGTTGTHEPTWATTPGATTNDGSAVWTCQGPAGWQALHAYNVNDLVEASFNVTVTNTTYQWGPGGYQPVTTSYTVTYDYFFQCQQAGNSGATTPAWSSGIGILIPDGQVVWKAIGPTQHWSFDGPSVVVSTVTTIVDSNGNLETVTTPGKSGATAPTWQTAKGAITVDGTVQWTNGGPYSAASTGAWTYAYAWKNSVSGGVSTASPLSTPIVLGADMQVVIQGPGSADSQVDTIVLYRTEQGGSVLMWMAEIPAPAGGAAWTYFSTQRDTDLNGAILAQQSSSNDPPPANLNVLTYHMGRIWGFVGNTLRYSNGPNTLSGNGNDAWPPLNNFAYPANGTQLWATSVGLVVFTVSDLALVTGQGIDNVSPFASIPFQAGIGLLTADAFGVNGSTAYIMTPNRRLLSLDPGAGELEVGFPVGDKFFSLYDPSNCNVTWHEGKSADTALYVADNEAGWFRMSAIAAPESGDLWSPRALITGGTSAVRSVEVLPGQKRLLIGPPQTGLGKILQRDDTVSSDNGTSFDAYADIGCIVLAQPGSIAGVYFITTDSVKIGSRPDVGLLLGELSGTFEMLARDRQDPPLLPPANTLYSDRFYAMQTQEPVWCRFMQMRVDFGAEAFPNELLTYSIFGTIENEVN